jgi:hypothetical protein
MYPPFLKSIFDGAKLAKSFAGLTMLAAMFVAKVEMATAIMAIETNSLLSNLPAKTTVSQIVVPNTMVVAEVTTTPTKADRVYRWRQTYNLTFDLCLLRSGIALKSGMLSDKCFKIRPSRQSRKKEVEEVGGIREFRWRFSESVRPSAAEIAQSNKASRHREENRLEHQQFPDAVYTEIHHVHIQKPK